MSEVECTGVAASWCPRCGDCSCPRNRDGERMEESNECHLHGESSQHAVDPPRPTVAEVRLAAVTEIVRAWRRADPSGENAMLAKLEQALEQQELA